MIGRRGERGSGISVLTARHDIYIYIYIYIYIVSEYFVDKFISKRWFGLVSLFNGLSTLFRLSNAEAILLEEQ